jgi:hypothetical protein
VRPAWIWYPYANSVEFPEVNQGGRTAMGGPVYHFDAASTSSRKLPRYYDKTVFIYEWSRNWISEVKLDDNGGILKINSFLPSFTFRRPMEMEIGPDGAIYMIEWGSSFGGGNTDAQVIRIDYVGGNPVVLQSVPTLPGTFSDETAAVVNPSIKAITVPQPAAARFYRLRATQATRISGVQVSGTNLVFTYE